jgi:hypothetical protein
MAVKTVSSKIMGSTAFFYHYNGIIGRKNALNNYRSKHQQSIFDANSCKRLLPIMYSQSTVTNNLTKQAPVRFTERS